MQAMEKLTRIVVGTVAAGAMAAATASPALARDHSGIAAGDVIAGALVIGGIAAVAAAASNDNRYDYGYGRDYRDRYGYGRGVGDRKSTRLNSSHSCAYRMPSSA